MNKNGIRPWPQRPISRHNHYTIVGPTLCWRKNSGHKLFLSSHLRFVFLLRKHVAIRLHPRLDDAIVPNYAEIHGNRT